MPDSLRPPSSSSTSSLMETTRNPSFIRSGIGGAGNYYRKLPSPACSSSSTVYSSPSQADTPPPPPPTSLLTSRPAQSFSTGIGGAGNRHVAAQKPAVTIEEKMARDRAIQRNARPARHVGIGGAGNCTAFTLRNLTAPSANSKTESTFSGEYALDSEYSNEPLPVGAVDIIQRKISRVLFKSRNSPSSTKQG